MKQLLEQGTGVVFCAMLPVIGFILRMVLYGYYTSLESACQRIKETDNRTVYRLRAELRRRKKNRSGSEPEDAYTDFYLDSCRLAGISVQTLERISRGISWMALLVGCLLAFAGLYLGCEPKPVLGMLFLNVFFVTALLFLDLFFGFAEKKQRIRYYFGDYAKEFAEAVAETEKRSSERVLAFPLVTEKPKPEEGAEELEDMAEPKRVTRKSTVKKEDAVKKLETAAKSRKEGRAQEEKRRLSEELTKERRQAGSKQNGQEGMTGMGRAKEPPEGFEDAREEYAAAESDTEKFEKIFRGMLMEMIVQVEKNRTSAEGE